MLCGHAVPEGFDPALTRHRPATRGPVLSGAALVDALEEEARRLGWPAYPATFAGVAVVLACATGVVWLERRGPATPARPRR